MAGFVRVSVIGDMPGGEVWSVNPVYDVGADFPPNFEQLITIGNAINSRTVPTALLVLMNPNTRVTGVRVESRNDDGSLFAVYEAPRTTPVAGTGTGVLPYQSSLVISLRTPVAGASGRGRLFWPATGALLAASTMRFSGTAQQAFTDAAAQYLEGIQDDISASSPGAELCVWSRTTGTSPHVNRIITGDVLDVQRRRRDTLAEGLKTATYPPA